MLLKILPEMIRICELFDFDHRYQVFAIPLPRFGLNSFPPNNLPGAE
jgi:hypothetical protein